MYKIPANSHFEARKLIYVPECHSTNTLLSELNTQSPIPEGSVLITDSQTAGRGQRGNTWETDPGKNLTFSTLFKPNFLPAKDQFQLNMAISLAVANGLKDHVREMIKLKWPNDIMIKDRKIGGILIENQLQGEFLQSSVVGIGININQEHFRHPSAASLYNFTHKILDLNSILVDVVNAIELEYLYLRLGTSIDLKQRYLNAMYKFREDQQFETMGEKFNGYIYDVDEQGHLCISTEGSVKKYAFKEVRFA